MANLPLYRRLLIQDPGSSSDADLLAVLISGTTGNRSPLSVSQELLHSAGGDLRRLGDIAVAQMGHVGGQTYARLVAAAELYRRAEFRRIDLPATVKSAEGAIEHLRVMGLEPYEALYVLYLSRRHQVLGRRMVTRGNLCHTILDPGQIFKVALILDAGAVIMAHNHPSGDPTPSRADVEVTDRCVQAGLLLGVEVLDHLVIAGGRYTSLREEGMMPERRPIVSVVK